jgi:cytidylate kinase
VRSAIEQRDLLDSTRSAAPLRQADDAELIDTTGMTAEAVADRIVVLAERARAASGR